MNFEIDKLERWICMLSLTALIFTAACAKEKKISLENILVQYIESANRHDLNALAEITSDSTIWYLGPDTLIGVEEVMGPLSFDEGAQTELVLGKFVVRGDTIDFDMVERNNVLQALGIMELHHYPRFIFRDGLIYRIIPRRPPLELEAFVDSVVSFARWLADNDPDSYDRVWPDGKFYYSRDNAELMIDLVPRWRKRGTTEP